MSTVIDNDIARALDALVARGTISPDQREAIVAEVGAGGGRAAADAGPSAGRAAVSDHRRTLTDVLVEVGLYVGSALVVAAGVVLTAQNWGAMSRSTQVAVMALAALVSAALGIVLAHGAGPGTARRRLAGVVLACSAVSTAGTTVVAMGDSRFTGTLALAVALGVMVVAHRLAPSIVTELGMFVAGIVLVNVAIEDFHPERDYYSQMTTYDRLMPLFAIAFGLLWALVVARRLTHPEVAVLLGMCVAVMFALPIIGDAETRGLGLGLAALLAAIGFWRFLVDGLWPWLAAAIASVTALVFWAVGGAQRPALAILVAGLVLLGSSALGMQVARRRRAAIGSGPSEPV